jgi:cyclase
MLKRRIVGLLTVREGIVVQSIGFNRYLPVGRPEIAVEFLSQWGIDEIVLNDISATRAGRAPDFDMVRKASERCRVPLTVGGGISSLEHIHQLMHCGADKVALNQILLRDTRLATEAAKVYGNQCVVASIDAILTDKGHRVYDYFERRPLELKPQEHAQQMEDAGAGEVLLNSVDRDGMKSGYDIPLIRATIAVLSVPLVACGGAGGPDHMGKVLGYTQASGVAAGNWFHFQEHSVTVAKAFLSRIYPIRHETHATYNDYSLDTMGRLAKKSDQILNDLLYLKIEKEEI